jgi:hypothetical protein
MSSKAWSSAFGYVVFLMAISSIGGCGSSSPVAGSKDGGTGTAGNAASGAGGAGGDQTGAGGDMTGTAGGNPTGAAGDMTGAAGTTTGAGGAAGGATGTAGKGGGAGAGGATGTAGKGGGAGAGGAGGAGNRDAGAGDAGATPMCRNATTCKASDPPCVRPCGTGRDTTCECGTGVLAGMLVCSSICERPDGGGATDGGAVTACPANIRSGTTACVPRTDMTCETPCQAMMHRQCDCAATGGGRGVWFCFKATACM